MPLSITQKLDIQGRFSGDYNLCFGNDSDEQVKLLPSVHATILQFMLLKLDDNLEFANAALDTSIFSTKVDEDSTIQDCIDEFFDQLGSLHVESYLTDQNFLGKTDLDFDLSEEELRIAITVAMKEIVSLRLEDTHAFLRNALPENPIDDTGDKVKVADEIILKSDAINLDENIDITRFSLEEQEQAYRLSKSTFSLFGYTVPRSSVQVAVVACAALPFFLGAKNP